MNLDPDAPPEAPALPDALDSLFAAVRELSHDLWTARDAADVDLDPTSTAHAAAVAALGDLARILGDADERLRRLAGELWGQVADPDGPGTR